VALVCAGGGVTGAVYEIGCLRALEELLDHSVLDLDLYVGVSGGASASTWASGSTYTQLSVPFTTGSSGTVTVFVHGWYAQGNVFADDFTIT